MLPAQHLRVEVDVRIICDGAWAALPTDLDVEPRLGERDLFGTRERVVDGEEGKDRYSHGATLSGEVERFSRA